MIAARRTLRRQGDAGAAADVASNDGPPNPECPECNSTWDDVMRSLLKFFPNHLVDPFSGKIDIMKGESQSCAVSGCDEYAIVSNHREIYSATVRVWNAVGYRTNFTSQPWHLQLYGKATDFDGAKFRQDLAEVLRHVDASDILIIEGPTQVQAPMVLEQEQVDTGCVAPACYTGYSGSFFGRPNYEPIRNLGYYYLKIGIIGPSERAIRWAQENLRGTENTLLDSTGMARRTHLLHLWKVVYLAEDVCLRDFEDVDPVTKEAALVCGNRTVDVFSPTYSYPEYQCPQNMYKDAGLARCMACGAQYTSATASTSSRQCFSCEPEYDGTQQRWMYTYLACDGKGCNRCPPNTLSSPGALGLKDCVTQPTITIRLKGPIDEGYTSEAVTAHRWARPYHKPFDAVRFRQVISLISAISVDRVALATPTDVWNYPASRCAELRGGCMFQVVINLQATDGPQLRVALQRIAANECFTYPPSEDCPSPDVNGTAALGRQLLMEEFEVVQVLEQQMQGRDSGECPDRYIGGTSSVSRFLDINKLAGARYACPSKFYMHALDGYCQPCPDMTTSDAATPSIQGCAGLNTVILAAKDASLTYEARTNTKLNGYVNAQPSALTLNDGAVSYLKIRGYALLPDQYVAPDEPIKGLQIDRCASGLNCFNESQFRSDLSALLETVTPNEVRLVKPNTCLFSNPATVYDGLRRTVPASMQAQLMCGPWPGALEMSGRCVCGRSPLDTRRCFYSKGTGMISRYLGMSVSYPVVKENIETVGACASSLTDEANAFLYHPGKMLCSARRVEESKHALDLCSSQSKLCREMAAYSSDVDVAAATGLLEPGMQMYWEISSRAPTTFDQSFAAECQHVTEDYWDLDLAAEDAACSRRLKSPLDAHYYLLNLHAETKADLDHAMHVLRGARGGRRATPTRVT